MSIEGNVDPGAVARTGIALLQDKVVASRLMRREAIERFRGKPGRTFETTVPGVLPVVCYPHAVGRWICGESGDG